MYLEFEVEGEQQLSRKLQGISAKLKNWTPEFKKVGADLVKTFKYNFKVEGRKLEKPWASLTPSTIAEKQRLGFGDKGILVRTGKLKGGFREQHTEEMVKVDNPVPYFKYHQTRFGKRTKLPRRVMIALTNKKKQEIVKVFQKAITKELQAR